MSQKNSSRLVALKEIIEETSENTGKEFFQALVKNLSQVLGIYGVWVTEYDPLSNELKPIAFWLKGKFIEKEKYICVDGPCEEAIKSSQIFHIPKNVSELFPKDKALIDWGAISYMGLALTDHDKKIIGHLAMIDDKPMEQIPDDLAIFKILAVRASSELRRLRTVNKLEENEGKLRRLFDGARETIIEFNQENKITQINLAGLNLFNTAREKIMGKNIDLCFDLEGNTKLATAMRSLERDGNDLKSIWLHGYLNCNIASETTIPTEASLSKYVVDSNIFYSLFLHSVKEEFTMRNELERVSVENKMLKEKVLESETILGESLAMQEVIQLIYQVASTDATVLITGETGTGKELVAKEIHNLSLRKNAPFITLNCATLSSELIESELFGHVKGAFTGATSSREGRFHLANEGTIFLDEIGELPFSLQTKLLRVIQFGEFEPLGSSKTTIVNVRILAATNRDLAQEVKNGDFREDLFYRLNVFPIHIPPLREREDDMIIIANSFLTKLSNKNRIKFNGLSRLDFDLLKSYNWPGNVRELQNVLERALILSRNGKIDLTHLLNQPKQVNNQINSSRKLEILNEAQMKELERTNIIKALEFTNWKLSGTNGASNILGIPKTTLSSRIKKYNILR